jgi:hypothetical protein
VADVKRPIGVRERRGNKEAALCVHGASN